MSEVAVRYQNQEVRQVQSADEILAGERLFSDLYGRMYAVKVIQ